MALILDLSHEQEAALKMLANAQGISPEEYAVRVLQLDKIGKASAKIDPAEKARQFSEWANSHRVTPPLSDEAVSRSSMYPDRD